MRKRKYTNLKLIEAEIKEMREAGKTRQEIAEQLGLEKVQIKNWVNRYNKRQAQIALGAQPRPKGRPRKDGQPPNQSEQKEIERLRMENRLLRDFLELRERK